MMWFLYVLIYICEKNPNNICYQFSVSKLKNPKFPNLELFDEPSEHSIKKKQLYVIKARHYCCMHHYSLEKKERFVLKLQSTKQCQKAGISQISEMCLTDNESKIKLI